MGKYNPYDNSDDAMLIDDEGNSLGHEKVKKQNPMDQNVDEPTMFDDNEKEEPMLTVDDTGEVVDVDNDDDSDDDNKSKKSKSTKQSIPEKDTNDKSAPNKTTQKSTSTKVDTKGDKFDIDYRQIAEHLQSKKLLTVDLPDEIKSSDDLLQVLEKEAIAYKQDYDTYLNQKYDGIIEYLENGGNLAKWKAMQTEQRYDLLKQEDIMSNTDLQEKLYREYYKSKGVKDTMIEKSLRIAKDREELAEEVITELLPELQDSSKKSIEQEKENTKLNKQKQDREYNNMLLSVEKMINDADSFIPTSKANSQAKRAILELAKGNSIFEEIVADPVKARVTLAALKYYGILDGKWDKIVNDVNTKVTRHTEKQIFSAKRSVGNEPDGDNGDVVTPWQAFENSPHFKKR